MRALALPLITLASIGMLLYLTLAYAVNERPQADGKQMSLMGYHYATKGVMSNDRVKFAETANPTDRREPLYPLLLSGVFMLYDSPELKQHDVECFTVDDTCPQLYMVMKIPNIALHILLVLATGWAAWVMTGCRVLTAAAIVIIACYSGYVAASSIFYAETLASLLFLLTSVFFYLSFFSISERNDRQRGLWVPASAGTTEKMAGTTKKWIYGILTGICLALLILTKAVFYYYWLFCVLALPVLIVLALKRKMPWGALGRYVLILLCAFTVFTPWMVRNYIYLDEFKIAGRGGEILSIRAEYDTMPWSDYPLAYVFFIPRVGQEFVEKIWGKEARSRFDREMDTSYYKRAKNNVSESHKRAAAEDTSLTEAALLTIKDNIVKHIALTPAFMFRGAFMQVMVSGQSLPMWLVGPTILLSLLFVPVGMFMTAWAAVKRDFRLWVFLCPAYFSYGFHAFMTHYIPRYSMPLIPVFLITLLLCIRWVWLWRQGKL